MKSLDSLPMRKDAVFNAGGVYELVIKINLCLHQEAIEKGFEIIANHLTKTNASKTLQILDLACGGQPLIPATLMQRLSDYQFVYTGADLNQDQINACKKYPFSKNVRASAMEGNVWELNELKLTPPYDIVFMGLNSHHGMPEEILFLAKDICRFLKPGGIFLNHDLFRPSQYPYSRKPEALRFIAQEKLQGAGISTLLSPALLGETNSLWREKLFAAHKKYMLENGCSEAIANEGIDHMREWDWPLSLQEMAEILQQAGFKTKTYSYQNTRYPLPEFFGLAVGVKP